MVCMLRMMIYYVLVIIVVVRDISATGFIQLKFLSYRNTEHVDTNGDCCDTKQSACRHTCENVFTICLDKPTNNNSDDAGGACGYGYYKSHVVSDDNVEFRSSLYDEKLTRLSFLFDQWTGEAGLTIKVSDIRKITNLVAQFDKFTLVGKPTIFNSSTSQIRQGISKEEKKRHRKSISFEYKIECHQDYLPSTGCFRKLCVPKNNATGHFNCSNTGEKICLEGWLDPDTDCTTKLLQASSSQLYQQPSSSIQHKSTIMQIVPSSSTSYFSISSSLSSCVATKDNSMSTTSDISSGSGGDIMVYTLVSSLTLLALVFGVLVWRIHRGKNSVLPSSTDPE